jgi:hypothetical protein
MRHWKDILYIEKTGEISHTKFWSNIGYFLMSLAFIGITVSTGCGYIFPVDKWIELFVVFGALVAIPRGFSKWINYKANSTKPCLDNDVENGKGGK